MRYPAALNASIVIGTNSQHACWSGFILLLGGMCAHAGSIAALPSKAELSQFCPPEVVLAATSPASRGSAPVDTSADMWAVGVMLLELLTGRCARDGALAVSTSAALADTDAAAAASAAAAAPVETPLAPAALEELRRSAGAKGSFDWEPGAPGSAVLSARLRGLKGVVLKCLSRDAATRPSAKQLLQVLSAFTAEHTVEELEDSDDEEAGQGLGVRGW